MFIPIYRFDNPFKVAMLKLAETMGRFDLNRIYFIALY